MSVVLLVDIGNTRTKWAVSRYQNIVQRGAVLNHDLAAIDLSTDADVLSVWVSCVASDDVYLTVCQRIAAQHSAPINRVVVSTAAAGLSNDYRTLDRLGVDRWVAAIGARAIVKVGPVIVVDAGTAVTVDCVSRDHRYLGGVILPGSQMMHDSLVGRTAGIQSSRLEVASVIGRSTQECVNSGAVYGLAGGIERVVAEMQESLRALDKDAKSCIVKVLICGGDAMHLSKLLPSDYQLEPDILFRGLQLIAEESGQRLSR